MTATTYVCTGCTPPAPIVSHELCAGCNNPICEAHIHRLGTKPFCDDCAADWCSECGEVKWSTRFDKAGKGHGYSVTYCTECEHVDDVELEVDENAIDEALGK